MKKVSVIIPAYNKAALTVKTIESVLQQTYKNVEIIVVDDGSTDDTRERLAPYCDRIQYVRKENGGACSARNMGIRLATGEYIGLLDCDDIYLPQKLELSVNYLEKNPDIGFVHTAAYLIDENGRTISVHDHPQSRHIGWVSKKLLLFNFICNSTVVVRKACFDRVGLFDESVFSPADFDMWVRLAEKYKAGYINTPLTKYLVSNSYILNNLEKVEKEDRIIFGKALQRNSDLGTYVKNKVLSNLDLRFATAYLRCDNDNKAKALFCSSLRRNPFHIKAAVYFACFLLARENFRSRLRQRIK